MKLLVWKVYSEYLEDARQTRTLSPFSIIEFTCWNWVLFINICFALRLIQQVLAMVNSYQYLKKGMTLFCKGFFQFFDFIDSKHFFHQNQFIDIYTVLSNRDFHSATCRFKKPTNKQKLKTLHFFETPYLIDQNHRNMQIKSSNKVNLNTINSGELR